MRKPDKEVEFLLDAEDKPVFVEIIKDFAADETLSLEDIGEEVPTVGLDTIFFVLRRGEEIRIYIANVNKPNKFHIGIHDWSGSSDWEPLWARLMARLHKDWPDKFPDPQGISGDIYGLDPLGETVNQGQVASGTVDRGVAVQGSG